MTVRAIITCVALVLVLVLIAAANRTYSSASETQLSLRETIAQRDSSTGSSPEPPRTSVDLAVDARSTRRVHVPVGGNLQAALDRAQPGDRIELDRGATYEGPYRLRRKEGDGWIVVTSAGADDFLEPGVRVDPSQASRMAKLVASSQ